MRWFAVALLFLGLPVAAAGAPAIASDSDVLRGVVLAESGDYDQAIDVLQGVVEASPDKRRNPKDLAVAFAYIGVARSGKGQDDKAKDMFKAALRLDGSLVLSSSKVPPPARALFEAVKQELQPRAEVKHGHGSRGPVILLGLAAAGGGAYALSRRSTGDANSTDTKTETFTGILDSKQPSSSVTLGPDRAGSWTATLSSLDSSAVFQLGVFTASSDPVTSVRQSASTPLVANWNGTGGASYRIDWSFDRQSAQQAQYTLTVTHPVP